MRLEKEPEPIGTIGFIRATLRPDGRYQDYYIARKTQYAWVWDVVPQWVYRRPANELVPTNNT
jgi:hypothetical protein